MTDTCKPPYPLDGDNDFHEVWWDSVAGGDAPKGKLQVQLHEVWQWMGEAKEPSWLRPGLAGHYSAEECYREGWRWVSKIYMTGPEMRMDGVPPGGGATL